MTKNVHRHDRRRFCDLGAKFWIYLVTGSSDSRANSKHAYNAYTRYRPNHVIGPRFQCPKGVPITSIYRKRQNGYGYRDRTEQIPLHGFAPLLYP